MYVQRGKELEVLLPSSSNGSPFLPSVPYPSVLRRRCMRTCESCQVPQPPPTLARTCTVHSAEGGWGAMGGERARTVPKASNRPTADTGRGDRSRNFGKTDGRKNEEAPLSFSQALFPPLFSALLLPHSVLIQSRTCERECREHLQAHILNARTAAPQFREKKERGGAGRVYYFYGKFASARVEAEEGRRVTTTLVRVKRGVVGRFQ